MPEAFKQSLQKIWLVYNKEIAGFFDSTAAYVVLVVFALIAGWFFSSSFFLINQSDLRVLFSVVPVIYLFFIPAISMGLIAKERNSGTMELLVTLPLEDWEVVLGKYLAAVVIVKTALAFTLVHFLTLTMVATNMDWGAVLSGYFGLVLVGGVYAAAGTFASSLTGNQITAFIIGFLVLFIFFMLDKALIFVPSFLAGPLQYMSIDYHLSNIARGVIDSRNLIYFASVIAFFLILTARTLEMRKWR